MSGKKKGGQIINRKVKDKFKKVSSNGNSNFFPKEPKKSSHGESINSGKELIYIKKTIVEAKYCTTTSFAALIDLHIYVKNVGRENFTFDLYFKDSASGYYFLLELTITILHGYDIHGHPVNHYIVSRSESDDIYEINHNGTTSPTNSKLTIGKKLPGFSNEETSHIIDNLVDLVDDINLDEANNAKKSETVIAFDDQPIKFNECTGKHMRPMDIINAIKMEYGSFSDIIPRGLGLGNYDIQLNALKMNNQVVSIPDKEGNMVGTMMTNSSSGIIAKETNSELTVELVAKGAKMLPGVKSDEDLIFYVNERNTSKKITEDSIKGFKTEGNLCENFRETDPSKNNAKDMERDPKEHDLKKTGKDKELSYVASVMDKMAQVNIEEELKKKKKKGNG